MKRANLKRKRSADISNRPSQLKITNYLDIPSSTPIIRNIRKNLSSVPKETVRNQLIRHNLDRLFSNGIDKAPENKTSSNPASNIESCRNSDEQLPKNTVEEQLLVDVESSHTTKYWREQAKYWEKETKKYKEQFDFTNNLLNRKLRQIET